MNETNNTPSDLGAGAAALLPTPPPNNPATHEQKTKRARVLSACTVDSVYCHPGDVVEAPEGIIKSMCGSKNNPGVLDSTSAAVKYALEEEHKNIINTSAKHAQ